MNHGVMKRVLITRLLVLLVLQAIISADASPLTRKLPTEPGLPVFTHGAVSANGIECAAIGKGILEKNGSAVDAAISTLLCDGTVRFESMGLGGGFLMTIWDPVKGEAFLSAREAAPAKATENMFNGNATASRVGGKAIAVPGELKGFWEAHQKYGKLPWADLFEPVIKLCLDGFPLNKFTRNFLLTRLELMQQEPSIAELLIDPETNMPWPVGHKLKRPVYANTLRQFAEFGPNILYNGSIGAQLIKEIQEAGGIMEMADLQNYTVKWSKPITSKFDNLTMFTSGPPGSGAILTFIMKVLHDFPRTTDKAVFWQRIIETFKWGYARRTELADPDFVDVAGLVATLTSDEYATASRQKITEDSTIQDPYYYGSRAAPISDRGTGNVCVLAPDGSAVSVTSTINDVLGSMVRSKSSGLILNNQMDDFSSPGIVNIYNYPPAKANFIRPGKRPLSSTTPTILVDENKKVRMVIGCAGGSRIISSTALTIMHHLYGGYNLKDAVTASRLHHQLIPMQVEYEPDFDENILARLRSIGHKTVKCEKSASAVTAISQHNGQITNFADSRRVGSIAGL